MLQKSLINNELVNDIGAETIQLIISYTKTWQMLLAYDEDKLKLPEKDTRKHLPIKYEVALQAISTFKNDLAAKGEATQLFGNERESALEGILGNIEQTFSG